METIQSNLINDSLIEHQTKEFGEEYKAKLIAELKTIGKLGTHNVGRKRQPEVRIADSFGAALQHHAGAEFDFLTDHFVASTWLEYRTRGGCVPRTERKIFLLSYTDESIAIIKDFFENPKPQYAQNFRL